MIERPHSTCEMCRAGLRLSEGTHRDTVPGTGVQRFRRCLAKCGRCHEVIKSGELFRVLPVPDGEQLEVHEACLG